MQITKKAVLFTIILGVTLMFSSQVSASTEKVFSDVDQTTKYSQAIEHLKNNGIVGGYPDGTFQPERTLNRAELLKILIEGTVAFDSAQATDEAMSNCFPDVKDEWFAPYVCYAKEKGIVSGYADGSFKPSKEVNKVEALKMIAEIWKYEKSKYSFSSSFDDVEKDSWYEPYVIIAESKRIIERYGNFYPANGLTRGEMANYIYSVLIIETPVEHVYVCEEDSDCAVVTNGCGCNAGGSFMSVNKNYIDYWERYTYLIKGGECLDFLNYNWNCFFEVKQTKCIQNVCQLVNPYEENGLSIMGNVALYDINTDIPYTNRMYAKGNDNIYYLSVKDILESNSFDLFIIEETDLKTFEFIDNSDFKYAQDVNNIYFEGGIVDCEQPEISHKYICDTYSK